MTNTTSTQHAERIARLALLHGYGSSATAQILEDQPATAVVDAMQEGTRRSVFARQAYGSVLSANTEAALARADVYGARFVIPGDAEWPTALDGLGKTAPLGLWVRGSGHLPDLLRWCVSLTGSAAASEYGERAAAVLASGLADEGVSVMAAVGFGVGGKALSTAARRGERAAAPVAVQAAGITAPYRREWQQLETDVVDAGGLVLSLYGGDTPASAIRHHQRRRLMACLSQATVVVESVWTDKYVEAAEEMERPLWAVPGRIGEDRSMKTNGLIRDGRARAVTAAADIVRVLDRP